MVTVEISFIECLLYILKSSKEAHHFKISFNLDLHQKHTPPPMFLTLFLERMAALSATTTHVPPRLPKPVVNVLPLYRYIFQENNFPKQYYALNTIFKMSH